MFTVWAAVAIAVMLVIFLILSYTVSYDRSLQLELNLYGFGAITLLAVVLLALSTAGVI